MGHENAKSDRGAARRVMAWVPAVLLVLVASPAAAQVGSPAGPVPVDRLEERRAALLERLGTGVAVLRSSDPRDLEGDYPQASDFRQDNDFFYLTGLETANSWLVLEAREDGADEVVLYLPARDPEEEVWTGPVLGPGAEAVRLTGIDNVRSSERAPDDILARLRAEDSPARRGGVFIKEGQAEIAPLEERLASEPVEVADLRPSLAALRLVKGPDELRRLRRAIDITTEAQREAMRAAHPGMWEYQLEAVIEYVFRKGGAERVGFPSIVGSGPNSTILHYDESRRQMQDGDVVVMDIGAEFGYYTADVTRTIPVSGRFSPRQRALYELVLATQRTVIDSVRPGITIPQLSRIARRYMRENSDTLCAPRTCDQHFVHGLSHWLGMDVHDVGDYSVPLAPGMVFTIEPGLYLPEEEIGIRIEDDILVTETGREILSADAPREAAAIEALMQERPRCCRLGGDAGGGPR